MFRGHDPLAVLEATRRCRVCGCSDLSACEGGCSWVTYDLCSACWRSSVERADDFADRAPHPGLVMNDPDVERWRTRGRC